MNKAEHGQRLRTAMASAGIDRTAIADAILVNVRTVTNWTTGRTMPSERERGALRRLLPGYDDPGDPVEVAILRSKLTEDRQHTVLGLYKRLLREQAEGSQTAM